MRNQRDQTGHWGILLWCSILLTLFACAAAGPTGRTTPHIPPLTILATGRTTGHTGDWFCTNDSREPVVFNLAPGILYAGPEYQPLIFTKPISVTVPPKTTMPIPIEESLCIDITRPAPPNGTPLTYIEPGPMTGPGTDFSSIPGFTPREGPPTMSTIPKVPGYEYPLDYTVDIQNHLEEAAPLLMAAAVSLNEAYDQMEQAGEINTPLPPELEEASSKQQTYWMLTSGLTGNEYKKTDLEENMKKDYERKTGQPIDAAPQEVKDDFYGGIDVLWDETFLPLAERAHLLNPASQWEGVDQKVWIETGPGGGSYTLPDGSASLTFSPYLDQPVSGTFFSRTYDIPGLKSYGFYPNEIVNDVPAPQLTLPFMDEETTVSSVGRRLWGKIERMFFPQTKPAPGQDISVPVAPTEWLVSKPAKPCVVPPEALIPPPAPEGYEYVGRDVVVNYVYRQALSTVPLERPHSPDDHVFMRSETEVIDGVTVCDWIVCHIFQPIRTRVVVCPVPEDMLEIPESPPEPGLRYVGRTVVVGFTTKENLCTGPMDRPHQSGDQEVIRSRTFMHEGVECEVIVSFLYEKE